MTARLVDVALPLPLFRAFTYSVPDGLRHAVTAGSRVVVPFRNRTSIGVVLGESSGETLGGVVAKPIIDTPDDQPAFCPDLLAVGRWMADYYVSPIGMVLRAALPAAMGRATRAEPSVRTQRVLRTAQPLDSLLQRDAIFKRAPQQRATHRIDTHHPPPPRYRRHSNPHIRPAVYLCAPRSDYWGRVMHMS